MKDSGRPDSDQNDSESGHQGSGGRGFDRHDRPDIDRTDAAKSVASTDKLESSEKTRNDRAAGSEKEKADENKNIFDELLERGRNLICRGFNTKYQKTTEPELQEDNRGFFEKVSDWMGLDSFSGIEAPSNPVKFAEEFAEGINDLMSNQAAMVEESQASGKTVNLKGRDKFWHSKANKEANARGSGGQVAAALGSAAKEVKDVAKTMVCRDWSYAAAIQDSMADQVANRQGRDEGRAMRNGRGGQGEGAGVRNDIRLRLH